jgi:hypothetical protein
VAEAETVMGWIGTLSYPWRVAQRFGSNSVLFKGDRSSLKVYRKGPEMAAHRDQWKGSLGNPVRERTEVEAARGAARDAALAALADRVVRPEVMLRVGALSGLAGYRQKVEEIPFAPWGVPAGRLAGVDLVGVLRGALARISGGESDREVELARVFRSVGPGVAGGSRAAARARSYTLAYVALREGGMPLLRELFGRSGAYRYRRRLSEMGLSPQGLPESLGDFQLTVPSPFAVNPEDRFDLWVPAAV